MTRKLLAYSPSPRITLLYACRTPSDCVLKSKLESLVQTYPDRLRIVYVIEAGAPADAIHGRITPDLLRKYLPQPPKESTGPFIFVSGPPAMMQAISGDKGNRDDWDQGAIGGILKDLGYTLRDVYKF